MATLRFLLKKSLKIPDINNSHKVYIRRISKNQNNGVYSTVTTTIIPGQKPRTHHQVLHFADVYMKGNGQKLSTPNTNVVVSCDCDRFKFYWEYALAKIGAAKIIYGNGDPPDTTNPTLRPALCKHLFRVSEHIVAKRI